MKYLDREFDSDSASDPEAGLLACIPAASRALLEYWDAQSDGLAYMEIASSDALLTEALA